MGFDDVTDFLVALKTMPPDSITDYLKDAFGDNPLNATIAQALGASAPAPAADAGRFYQKKRLDEDGDRAPKAS
eukprot:1851673-Prymnesium_polylepis.1